jgi:hypothetical protein
VTAGTCGMRGFMQLPAHIGCSPALGAVQCRSGACVCNPGACIVGHVCKQTFGFAAGCGASECSWKGMCMPCIDVATILSNIASNSTMKIATISDTDGDFIGSPPDMVSTYLGGLLKIDEPGLMSLASASLACLLVSLILWQVRIRMHWSRLHGRAWYSW